MANARAGNVIVVDTSATFAFPITIEGIRIIPGTGTPSVTIKQDDSSGTVLYENANTSPEYNQVCIKSSGGIYVAVAGTGTKVYLYTK
jgi:hypothetical protein